MPDEDEARVVAAVLSSPKYRYVSEELVRQISREQLKNQRGVKDAIKATKNKLHQVAGAYHEGIRSYQAWLAQLQTAAGDTAALRAAAAGIMAHHTSTRERLPILDTFYATTLARIGPIHSVLDIACGLNPLAAPWMPLAPDASYAAYDIYGDMMGFLQSFFDLAGIQGRAEPRDVLAAPPGEQVQVALLLKAIPCLEQIDKAAGERLLASIDAEYLLISFPIHSLGGRGKGMVANYAQRLEALVAGKPWQVERYDFRSELAFLVRR